jgi:hypothetical protein
VADLVTIVKPATATSPNTPYRSPHPTEDASVISFSPPLNDRPLFQLPEKAIFKAGEPAAGRDSV